MKDDMVVTSHIDEVMQWLDDSEKEALLSSDISHSECEQEIYFKGLIIEVNQDDYTFTASVISEILAGRIKIYDEKIHASKPVYSRGGDSGGGGG